VVYVGLTPPGAAAAARAAIAYETDGAQDAAAATDIFQVIVGNHLLDLYLSLVIRFLFHRFPFTIACVRFEDIDSSV
jgi:hypothetical protein